MRVGDLGLARTEGSDFLKELMMSKFKQVVLGLLLATSMLMGGTTFAQVSLAPGGFVTGAAADNDDTTASGIAGSPAGSFLASMSVDFTAATFSGHIFSGVSNNNTYNPFGAGFLSFFYQFQNDSDSAHEINHMTLNGFGGVETYVAWNGTFNAGCSCRYLGEAPTTVDRGSGNGSFIDVNYSQGNSAVAPGEYGSLWVYTDRTTYSLHTALLQDGSQATADIYAPVPEPEIYAMLAAGLGFMGFVARRRKQVAA